MSSTAIKPQQKRQFQFCSHIPVSEWKAKAEEMGLDWRNVRDAYSQVKSVRREYNQAAREVRNRVFSRTGVNKGRVAFHGGDVHNLRGFDVLADCVALESPWVCRSGDNSADLFDLLSADASEFEQTDNQAWEEALQLALNCAQLQDKSTDDPF